jgi:hypothetical protein
LLGLLELGGNPRQRKDMYGNKWKRPSFNNGTQMVDNDDDDDDDDDTYSYLPKCKRHIYLYLFLPDLPVEKLNALGIYSNSYSVRQNTLKFSLIATKLYMNDSDKCKVNTYLTKVNVNVYAQKSSIIKCPYFIPNYLYM